jgi:hypothetical protein
MGWQHSKQRNRLAADTTEMLTAIKLHYDSFAPVKLSADQQAKRARFDAAVASSIAAGDSLAGAAEIPSGLLAQIDANRQAAQGEGGDEEEPLTDGELEGRLQQIRQQHLYIAERDMFRPPEGFSSWQDAVRDAFAGWDFGDNLLDNSYTEVFPSQVVEVRPPTYGQFDPAAMAEEEQQQELLEQQQRVATQQQLLRNFQQAGMMGFATTLQQQMVHEHVVHHWRV